MALNREFYLFHFSLNFLQFKLKFIDIGRVLRRLIWVCIVCKCHNIKPSSGGFTYKHVDNNVQGIWCMFTLVQVYQSNQNG